MSMQTIGDLAQSFAMRHQNTALKTTMTRLTQELASGRTTDVTKHLSASFGHLADVENQMLVQQGYRTATREAAIFTSGMQAALEQVQNAAEDMGGVAALAGAATDPTVVSTAAQQARNGLDTIVAALNTEVAGRPLFSGTDLDGAPLLAADQIITAARVAVAGAIGPGGYDAALEAFFNAPGGGFETLIYHGGTQDAAPYRLGAGESVQLSIRADDAALRATMKSMVAIAMSDDPALALDDLDRRAVVRQAGEQLLTRTDQIIAIRADLGFAEARIEQSGTRIAAELTSLEYSRGHLLSVDPFDVATELESVQFQLETLYTLTARSSRLNLMNFLS